MSSVKKIAIGVVASIALTGAGLTPASASDESRADTVANFIDEVRPSKVENVDLKPRGNRGLVNALGNVELPASSDGAISIESATGTPLVVELPGRGTSAVVATDGTLVYGEEDGVTFAVQAGRNEVRIHSVVADAGSLEDYTYRFPGLVPELNSDGSVSLFAEVEGGGIQASVGSLDAPWASDAKGSAVDTRYRVEGSAVVQEVVVTDETVFPIVADPRFQGDCGWATCTLRFDRQYTKTFGNYGGDVGAMVAGLSGAAMALGGPVGAAIGAFGAIIIAGRAKILSSQAKDFYSNGNCFGIKFPAGAPTAGWGTQVKRNTYNCR